MKVPSVHNNGTSKQELINQFAAASDALESAYQALKQTAPNGRDYYVQDNNALGHATIEHDARLSKVDEVKKEVDALILAIDEQE